ncbi:hypothetical protein R2F61_03260 [Mollicutes bacterium LVI A0078]|nr:hypothetical protein RZE84_03290 [Mollicutes bacterium LVI A0075]WOO91582.1 hypothetical protein R2F61_03260 [Mollicutes bacterium LVI A0078]
MTIDLCLDILGFIGIQLLFWIFIGAMSASCYLSIILLWAIAAFLTSLVVLYFFIKIVIRLYRKANQELLRILI